jgi:hypothetical protein
MVLFVIGAALIGSRPAFDAPGAQVAAHFAQNSTRIQVGSAFLAALAPFFVWFLATIASLTRAAGPERSAPVRWPTAVA